MRGEKLSNTFYILYLSMLRYYFNYELLIIARA
jgi:hypothetical protein